MSEMTADIRERLDQRAHWIRPWRIGQDDEALNYTGVWFPDNPRRGIGHELRKLEAVGWIAEEITGYALDVMSEEGDLLDTFSVSREAFARLRARWKFVRDRSAEEAYAEYLAGSTPTREEGER